jgi:hypothetical protein
MREVARDTVRMLDAMQPDRSCWTCQSASIVTGGKARCRKWDSEIPREALEAGCDSYSEDEIPF